MSKPNGSGIDAALRRSPAQPLFRWRASRRLAVLAYHEVEDAERFARHLDHVKQALHPVSLDEVEAAADGRGGLPRRAVLITSDDGHRSVYETALPLLSERGLPAAFYIIAGLVGTDVPFWWEEVKALARTGGVAGGFEGKEPAALAKALKYVPDEERLAALDELRRTSDSPAPPMPQLRPEELRELESAGVAVGNHTLTHPCLRYCNDKKIKDEIAEAHGRLTDVLGHAPTSFAYPNGSADERVVEALKDVGYRAAFLFDHRLSEAPPTRPFRISRLVVGADASLDRFRIIVSGLHPALLRMRGRGPTLQE